MTTDDILRMAREQGLPETETEGVFRVNADDLGRILAAEREACAISCEVNAARWIDSGGKQWGAAHECADAIRARGKT